MNSNEYNVRGMNVGGFSQPRWPHHWQYRIDTAFDNTSPGINNGSSMIPTRQVIIASRALHHRRSIPSPKASFRASSVIISQQMKNVIGLITTISSSPAEYGSSRHYRHNDRSMSVIPDWHQYGNITPDCQSNYRQAVNSIVRSRHFASNAVMDTSQPRYRVSQRRRMPLIIASPANRPRGRRYFSFAVVRCHGATEGIPPGTTSADSRTTLPAASRHRY